MNIVTYDDCDIDEITRAEMCEIVCKITIPDIQEILDETTLPEIYYDVPRSHWAYEYIYITSMLYETHGDGNGYFRPDDLCTYGEFLKTILAVAGWGKYKIKTDDVFPFNYYGIAKINNLTIERNKLNSPINVNDVFLLTYEAMTMNTLKKNGYGGITTIEPSAINRIFEYDCFLGHADDIGTLSNNVQDRLNLNLPSDLGNNYLICYYQTDDMGENNVSVVYSIISKDLYLELYACELFYSAQREEKNRIPILSQLYFVFDEGELAT